MHEALVGQRLIDDALLVLAVAAQGRESTAPVLALCVVDLKGVERLGARDGGNESPGAVIARAAHALVPSIKIAIRGTQPAAGPAKPVIGVAAMVECED